jgi:hypothetical protein
LGTSGVKEYENMIHHFLIAILAISSVFATVGCQGRPETPTREINATPVSRNLDSGEGKFKVNWPSKPALQVEQSPDGSLWLYTATGKGFGCSVAYGELSELKDAPPEVLQGRLTLMREGLPAAMKGKLIRSEEFTLQGKYRGYELSVAQPHDGWSVCRTRFFIVKGYLYQVTLTSRKDASMFPEANEFLDSFEIVP